MSEASPNVLAWLAYIHFILLRKLILHITFNKEKTGGFFLDINKRDKTMFLKVTLDSGIRSKHLSKNGEIQKLQNVDIVKDIYAINYVVYKHYQ